MLTNQSRAHIPPHPHLCCGSHSQALYSPALITLGLGTRQLGTAPTPQTPLKWLKLANPNSIYFIHCFYRHHPQRPSPCFSLPFASWPTQILLPCSSQPSLGSVSIASYLFNGNCLLICCWCPLNKKKTYILIHTSRVAPALTWIKKVEPQEGTITSYLFLMLMCSKTK